jgi:cytochrome c553
MPRHIVRLLLLFATFGLAAIGAKVYFTDESYGLYGRYRGDAIAEIAADEPLYKGSSYCQSCHGARHTEWSAGIHKVVNCETCHGAAVGHPAGAHPSAPTDKHMHSIIAAERRENVKLAIPADSVKLCTLCHQKMPGRPATQRQIVVSSHAGTQQCIVCHNPHSPKPATTSTAQAAKLGDAAAGGKKAAICATCHGAQGVSGNPVWPSLAGQHGEYLVGALQAYKSKMRGDPLMTEQAKNLSEVDISDLAAYFASLNCATTPSSRPAQVASEGRAKAAICATCHGAAGVSTNPVWPSLAGQQEAYLVNALKAYQTGTRQNPIMAGIVKGLSESDFGQIAAYFTGLNCKK